LFIFTVMHGLSSKAECASYCYSCFRTNSMKSGLKTAKKVLYMCRNTNFTISLKTGFIVSLISIHNVIINNRNVLIKLNMYQQPVRALSNCTFVSLAWPNPNKFLFQNIERKRNKKMNKNILSILLQCSLLKY
jgi:hypothetical protein